MSLREGLTTQDAYAALMDATDDHRVRDELIGSAGYKPGEWTWTALPDGSGLGILCETGPDGMATQYWSVNHVMP